MDINYWLIGSQNFIDELNGVTANQASANFFDPQPAQINATQFPLLNYLKPRTVEAVREAPEWYENLDFKTVSAHRVIQLYSFQTEYALDVVVREDLQTLEDAYPADCLVAGCWDVATGEPVGGVGSPWFTTPPELLQYMPDEPTGPGTFQPATKMADVNLLAGQKPRKFV